MIFLMIRFLLFQLPRFVSLMDKKYYGNPGCRSVKMETFTWWKLKTGEVTKGAELIKRGWKALYRVILNP